MWKARRAWEEARVSPGGGLQVVAGWVLPSGGRA